MITTNINKRFDLPDDSVFEMERVIGIDGEPKYLFWVSGDDGPRLYIGNAAEGYVDQDDPDIRHVRIMCGLESSWAKWNVRLERFENYTEEEEESKERSMERLAGFMDRKV